MTCERCGGPARISTGSMFDTSQICTVCETEEVRHPEYDAARAADRRAVMAGNFNFVGVGCPRDLLTAARKRRSLRIAVLEAVELMTASEEAADADAGFDGGEFSGPAHAATLDQDLTELAERRGVSRQELEGAICALADPDPQAELELVEDREAAERLRRDAQDALERHGIVPE